MSTLYPFKKIALATAAALSLSAFGAAHAQTTSATPAPGAEKAPAPQTMHRHGDADHGGKHGAGSMDRMAERLLSRVKATPEQKAQIQKIMDKAHQDMQAQRGQHEALHKQALALMAAPQLDPAAAEKLRQSMLAEHDQRSKAMMNTLLEVGKVLTPEQRKQLADELQKQGERRGGRHGGHHGGHGDHGMMGGMGGMGGSGK